MTIKISDINIFDGNAHPNTPWAANQAAPLSREEQIHLMQTAGERHAARHQRLAQILTAGTPHTPDTTV